jgi:hypothetical protein
MKAIEEEYFSDIIEILDENYDDGIDRIESAWEATDGTIHAIAWDGDYQFVAHIGADIEIALANEVSVGTAKFAEPKPRSCKAGISCGGTCIAKGKNCRKKASSAQAAKAEAIKSKSKTKASPLLTPDGIMADGLRYAEAMSKADNKSFFHTLAAHIVRGQRSPEDHEEFGNQMIAKNKNRKKKPLSDEDRKEREQVVDTAIKFGLRTADETKGTAKQRTEAFVRGALAHITGDEDRREIHQQVLEMKPRKKRVAPDFKSTRGYKSNIDAPSTDEGDILKILKENRVGGR